MVTFCSFKCHQKIAPLPQIHVIETNYSRTFDSIFNHRSCWWPKLKSINLCMKTEQNFFPFQMTQGVTMTSHHHHSSSPRVRASTRIRTVADQNNKINLVTYQRRTLIRPPLIQRTTAPWPQAGLASAALCSPITSRQQDT